MNKTISPGALVHKIKRLIKPARGFGFSGDSRQQLRSQQIAIFRQLGLNENFVNNYPELLTCNESFSPVADKVDVGKLLEEYFQRCEQWKEREKGKATNLKGWVHSKGHVWPNIHPTHQKVVDTVRKLHPSSVLEAGAGAGMLAKYVFAALEGKVNLSCVELLSNAIAEMKENFSSASDTILPKMEVIAEIRQGLMQKLSFESNSQELVYTCTVMMHNPFIAAVAAAAEFARVSSRYILHVEGYHTDGIEKYMGRSRYNLLLIDYERLYRKLGFKVKEKYFYSDPYSEEYDYIFFLAEKIN
jgi:hypothetical protein